CRAGRQSSISTISTGRTGRRHSVSPDCSEGRGLARLALLIDVPRPQHLDLVTLFLLRREPGEIEHLAELDPEPARLSPAHHTSDRTHADDIDGQLGPRRYRKVTVDHRAHRRDVAQLHLDHGTVDAGHRSAHQPVARLTRAGIAFGFDRDAVGKLARDRRFARLSENEALDHADAELA